MKKFMEKLKSFSSRVITILLIELLVVSAIPLNANAGQPNINNNFMQYGNFGFDFGRYFFGNNEIPLILSYSVDKVNGKLILSWNKTVSKYKRYYVLSRNKDDWKFELACDKSGIAENNWTCDLGEAMNKYFTVCEAGMPVYYGYGFYNPYYRYDMDYSRKSNQVYIDDNSARKPGRPEFVDYVKYGHEATLSWGMRTSAGSTTDISYFLVFEKSKYKNFFFMEKDYSHIDRSYSKYTTTRYYVWAIDKNGNASNPLIYESKGINDNGSNDNTGIDGVYRIDETKITTITYQGVTLEIPAGATLPDTAIAINTLGINDINKTPDETPNVTAATANFDSKGYEIYFNGKSDIKFLKDIKISYKYDPTKITEGYSEDYVFIYYFDDNMGSWQMIKRDSVDKDNDRVIGLTDHFCQFYAGVMSVGGEPPQAKGINTTPMNISAVDPMAGIRGINPPTPNNQGSANVGYGIEVPAGINGMTPGVSISYSSEARGGNCGYGWNLGVSSITIDTKKSVPKYDGTDTLLLDGRELVSIGNNIYRYKNESAFSKIVYDTVTGGFVVYQTNGTKLYYGINDTSKLYNPDNTAQVYSWLLSKIADKFGNEIVYNYDPRTDNITGKRINLSLNNISYGYKDPATNTYAYKIQFEWTMKNADSVNYFSRAGFMIADKILLNRIIIYDKTSVLRIFALDYYTSTGANGKLLLKNIYEISGEQRSIVNLSEFEYEKTEDNWAYSRTNISIDLPKYENCTPITADFNGDGISDILMEQISEGRNTGNRWILFGNAYGGFIEKDISSLGFVNCSPMIGDFNGDGLADILMEEYSEESPNKHTGKRWILFGKGDGTFDKTPNDTLHYLYMGYIPYIGDFDGDGKSDILMEEVEYRDNADYPIPENYHTGNRAIFYSKGDGTFDISEVTNNSLGGYEPYIGDFNGDGRQDILLEQITFDRSIGYKTHTGNRQIFFSNNNRTFTQKTFTTNDFSNFIPYIGDFNGDGRQDILMEQITRQNLNIEFHTGYRAILYVHDDGTFDRKDITWPDFEQFQPVIGDYDGDGRSDILLEQVYGGNLHFGTPNNYTGYRSILFSKAFDVFERKDITWPDFVEYAAVTGDFNGDGRIDILMDKRDKNTYSSTGYRSILFSNLMGQTDGYIPPRYYSDKINQIKKITNIKTGTVTELTYRREYIDNNRLVTNNYRQRDILTYIQTHNGDVYSTTGIDYVLDSIGLNDQYIGGIYDKLEREFRGFETVKVSTNSTNSTFKTETKYHINDIRGYYGLTPIYNQYLYGQVDTVSRYANNRILGKQKYEYETAYPLTGNSLIKYIYPKTITNWLYDHNGNYIGKGTAGDVASEVDPIVFDANGLPTGSTSVSHGDPYNTNDEVTTTVTNKIDAVNWLCMPEKTETWDNNSKLLGTKEITYNDTATVTEIGAVIKQRSWEIKNNVCSTLFDTSYTYNVRGEVATVTGPDGNTVSFTNNYAPVDTTLYKEVTKTVPNDPGSFTETSKIDKYGRLVESVDIYGESTKYIYDDIGRIIKVYEPDDPRPATITTSTVPTSTDLPSKIFIYETEETSTGSGIYYFKATAMYKDRGVDVNHYLIAQFYKNGAGISVQSKAQSEVDGTLKWVVSGKAIYDQYGRVVKSDNDVTTADIITVNEGYVTKEMGTNFTTYEYDEMMRLNKITTPSFGSLGTLTINAGYEIVMDGTARILSKQTLSDNADHESSVYKDMSGVEVKTETKKDSGTLVTTMDYDLSGYAKLNEGMGLTGEKQYDNLGRLVWIKSPDAGKKEYFYNIKGQVETIRDYGKTESDYKDVGLTYDTLGRITTIDYPGTECDITYRYYDTNAATYARGNIYKVTKGNGFSVEYQYEKYAITEIKTIEGASYSTRYDYDIQGRIKTLTYPDGEVVTYGYNDGGALASITGVKSGVSQTYISDILYNEYGQKTSTMYGNGTEQTYNYDPKTRLLDKYITKKGETEHLNYNYEFDMSGNITGISNTTTGDSSTQGYTYDTLGRLTSGTGNYMSGTKTYSEAYTYDDYNRMLTKSDGTTIYTYNYKYGTHAVETITGTNNTTANFEYNDYGQMTKKQTYLNSAMTGTTDFSYNDADELTQIDMGASKLEFKYDAGGQRIKKTYKIHSNVISTSIYVNGFYTIKDGQINKSISDGTYVIATKVGNSADNILYLHQNHIGSTAMLTDKDGNVKQSLLYKPYGDLFVATGTPSNGVDRYFTNQILDKESGLYYMNSRYYDASIAAFITPDPMMAGSNHYSYVSCKPIKFNDPTGNEEEDTGYNENDANSLSWSQWTSYVESCGNADPNDMFQGLANGEKGYDALGNSTPTYSKETLQMMARSPSTAVGMMYGVGTGNKQGAGAAGQGGEGGFGGGSGGNIKTELSNMDEFLLKLVFGQIGSSPINYNDWISKNGCIYPQGLFANNASWRLAPHTGLDLSIDTGVNVWATAPGKIFSITYADETDNINHPWGNQVVIDHGFGIKTYYSHLDTINPYLKVGDSVNTNFYNSGTLGTVGATGFVTGSHLDYQVQIGDKFINPKLTLPFWYDQFFTK